MSMKFPEIGKIRTRVQSKVAQMKGRFRMQQGGFAKGLSGQRIGGGQIANKVRSRLDQATRKIKERRPGMIPQVKEFKPGKRIRQMIPTAGRSRSRIRPDLTSLPMPTRSGKGMSIADEPAYPYNGRDIVIEA